MGPGAVGNVDALGGLRRPRGQSPGWAPRSILMSPQRVQWSGLAFAVACAATLGLLASAARHRSGAGRIGDTGGRTRRCSAVLAPRTVASRCALAGFGVLLLASTVVFAVIGTTRAGWTSACAGADAARLRDLPEYRGVDPAGVVGCRRLPAVGDQVMRWAATLAVMLFVAAPALAPAPALAIDPPQVPPGPPPTGPVAPLGPTEQKATCGVGAVLPGSQFQLRPSAAMMLNYAAAWRFSTGAGQKVAVIDTGVSPNPRLRALQPGGDYVSTSDGLVDCDAHGTLVAGLIAAAPSPDDAFAGVAPDAAILSIRQNSESYSVQGSGPAQNDPNSISPGYGNTQTLALAIVHAVDLGATVINLSEAACAPVGTGIDDAAVGQAIRYAFDRNVVVVAAAGNISSQGLCSAQNEPRDPNLPLADAWNSVRTVASPAWFSDYVLTVGVGDAGRAAKRLLTSRTVGGRGRTGRAVDVAEPQRYWADQRLAGSAERSGADRRHQFCRALRLRRGCPDPVPVSPDVGRRRDGAHQAHRAHTGRPARTWQPATASWTRSPP